MLKLCIKKELCGYWHVELEENRLKYLPNILKSFIAKEAMNLNLIECSKVK